MIWFLATLDLAAGLYLLGWTLTQRRRIRRELVGVSVALVLCAIGVGVVGLGQPEVSPAPALLEEGSSTKT